MTISKQKKQNFKEWKKISFSFDHRKILVISVWIKNSMCCFLLFFMCMTWMCLISPWLVEGESSNAIVVRYTTFLFCLDQLIESYSYQMNKYTFFVTSHFRYNNMINTKWIKYKMSLILILFCVIFFMKSVNQKWFCVWLLK